MTPWIVDASVAIAWYLKEEENQDYAIQVLMGLTGRSLYMPSLFFYELSNVLVVALRRKRITQDALEAVWHDLKALHLQIDTPTQATAQHIAALAIRYDLTCYDAAYLDLASRMGFPIATVDKGLIRAMQAAGVELVAPVRGKTN